MSPLPRYHDHINSRSLTLKSFFPEPAAGRPGGLKMIEKLKKLSLEKQLFISFFSLCALLLLLSLSMTLTFNLSRQRQDIDRNLSSIASYIASMEQIVSMLEIGYPVDSIIKELDSLSENFSDISVIAVYNTDGLRFYHTDRHETGETYLDGEEAAILAGSPPYITVGYGTYGTQRRAFHSVRNAEGEIIGYVTVSVFTDYISRQAQTFVLSYFFVGILMLLVSLALTHGIIRALRSSLMGHHPMELLDLYIQIGRAHV